MKHDERPTRCSPHVFAGFAALLVCGFLVVIAGCGANTISESSMKKYALRNKPEPKEDNTPAPPKTPATPPADRVASADRTPRKPSAAAAAAVKPPPAPVDYSQPVTDTESPPMTPLPAEERTKRTVKNLKRIAEAFHKHLAEKGYYPARAVFDGNKPNLSWRVALLPYLGYQRLYDEFRLDEPWNSRHNYELLKKIPSVYQSPERFDDHTNYEVAVSSSSVFRRNGVVRISDFDDGAKDCAMLVEVDDVSAVPWTEPHEFEPDLRTPNHNLGALRNGSFFLIWGNAEVGRVATSSPPDQLRAMFTHDAGEVFHAGQVDRPLFETPTRAVQTASALPNDGSKLPDTTSAPSASSSASPDNPLAADYLQQSNDALTRGDESAAISYYYAAAITSSAGGSWPGQFQWVSALRRPAAVVRFGIGLDYSGPKQERRGDEDDIRSSRRSSPQSRSWNAITGDFGQKLVEILIQHQAAHGNASLLAQQPPEKKSRTNLRSTARRPSARSAGANGLFAPGVEFLVESREPTIHKLAQRQHVDLAVIVDWRDTARGWSVGMDVVDVVRDMTVWKMPRVQSRDIDRAKANPLTDNPLDEQLREFKQFLEDECVFQPIPAKLEARHAAQRVTSLAASDEPDPLRSLAEMRLYQELGLIDAPQLLKAYQAKLGDDNAIQLLLGSPDAKRQLLKTMLPAPPLVADRLRPTNSP